MCVRGGGACWTYPVGIVLHQLDLVLPAVALKCAFRELARGEREEGREGESEREEEEEEERERGGRGKV